ncbi:MAG: hypothetical protein NUV74_07935 [Candidatus Brocadiaceae bacterium]|nr:hypothetical protein [Candidatus Brocadiaceae bacterium]
MPIINDDVKAIRERISSMCSNAESVLNLCMSGFLKYKAEMLDDAQRISKSVHDEENEILGVLSSMKKSDEADKALIKSLSVVTGHIELSTDIMDNMIRHIRVILNEKILFSDKAVKEVTHLFKETLDVLKTARDAIVTKNEVLRKHILDKYESVSKLVSEYSEEHEERLVMGICTPRNASLYLNIVDSQLKVVMHIKQAIERYFSQ